MKKWYSFPCLRTHHVAQISPLVIFSVLTDVLYSLSPAEGIGRNLTLGRKMAKFDIPDHKYLRIGDVSRLLGIKPSVVRFWESQFPRLKPKKTRRGQRIFNPEDVELLREIQRELKETGMTIEGLKKKMAKREASPQKSMSSIEQEQLLQIRIELQAVLDLLKTGE